MDESPNHLRIETYYLSKVQDVKDHILGMLELALPENERIRRTEDWQRLLYSPEGQFQVLFASLEQVRAQIGEATYTRLLTMANEAKQLFVSGDERAFAFKLQDMDTLAWMPKRGSRNQQVAQN